MFIWNQPEAALLVKQLEACTQVFLDHKKTLLAHYGFDAQSTDDMRVVVFSKYINTINSTIYGHLFLDQDLRDKEWWQKVGSKPPAKITYDLAIEQWEVFLRWGLFHAIFSIYESFLRIVIRAIDPSACSCGTAEFQSVYSTLFSNRLSRGYPHAIELSNLLRLIRNMIHNNGLYVSEKHKSLTVICNGKSYVFEHMKDPHIVTWGLILELLHIQATVLTEVGLDTIVKKIPHVKDNYIAATRHRLASIGRS